MGNNSSDTVEDAVYETLSNKPAGPSNDERQWAVGCHLIALLGYIVPVPSANLLGPLVLWLIKRVDSPFINAQGKESLNFQISLFIYELVCLPLILVGVGVLLIVLLRIFGLVCVITASVKISNGQTYRYPACIRLIK
jgi:uncharacterized Tic20 family protein